jgi:hypothetical protein
MDFGFSIDKDEEQKLKQLKKMEEMKRRMEERQKTRG